MSNLRKVNPLVFDCLGGIRELDERSEAVPHSLSLDGYEFDSENLHDGGLLVVDKKRKKIHTIPREDTPWGYVPSPNPGPGQVVMLDPDGWFNAVQFAIRQVDLSKVTEPTELKPYEIGYLRFNNSTLVEIPVKLTVGAFYVARLVRTGNVWAYRDLRSGDLVLHTIPEGLLVYTKATVVEAADPQSMANFEASTQPIDYDEHNGIFYTTIHRHPFVWMRIGAGIAKFEIYVDTNVSYLLVHQPQFGAPSLLVISIRKIVGSWQVFGRLRAYNNVPISGLFMIQRIL